MAPTFLLASSSSFLSLEICYSSSKRIIIIIIVIVVPRAAAATTTRQTGAKWGVPFFFPTSQKGTHSTHLYVYA